MLALLMIIPETDSALEEVRPPLKWAGGKRWLLPELAPLWRPHRHRRLVEPFVGGMAVALGLAPSRALLNDVNPHLMNFYRWLKEGLKFEQEFINDSTHYYAARSRFNQLVREDQTTTKEAAEWFYYLNRTGYNGLCRFNSKGEFNVPFGKYKAINYESSFSPLQDRFPDWQLTNTTFARVPVKSGDFIYADPPYDVEFTAYTQNQFGWADQEMLANWLSRLDNPMVVSNQATPRIVCLYENLGFEVRRLPAPRRISCNGDRTLAEEMLATRNL